MANGNSKWQSTKHVPNSPWFANAMRSMGISSTDVLKTMAPTSYNVGKSAGTVSKNAATTMKQYSSGARSMMKDIKSNPYVKVGDTFFKNALSDLKTGKFVNLEREQEAVDKLLGETFGDIDDLFNFDDIDFDEDSNVNVEINNVSINNSIDRSADTIASAIAIQTDYQIKTAKASNDTIMATVVGVNANLTNIGSSILSSLNSINENLSALVTYQSENMTKFIEASIKYYDEQSSPAEAYISDSTFDPNTVFNDGFSVDNYMKSILTNINKTYKDSILGTMSSAILDYSDMLTAQPLEFVTKSLIQNAIPKVLEKSLKQFDETLTEFIPTLLDRIADMGDSSNTIRSAFGKIFGVRDNFKGQINLGKSLEDNKAVPFDKITRHTIVDLIPTYMRKMISIMEGTPEMYYDRTTGRHVELDTIKNNIYETLRNDVVTRFKNDSFDRRVSSRGDKLIDSDKAEYDKLVDSFYLNLEKSTKEFNPIQQGVNAALAGIFGTDASGKVKVKGVSDEILNYFKAAVKSATPEEIMTLSKLRMEASRQKSNTLRMYEDNPDEFNMHSLSYDSPYLYAELDKRYNPSVAVKDGQYLSNRSIPKSLIQTTLEDIRMLLNRGIDVSVIKGGPFSDSNRKRNKKLAKEESESSDKLSSSEISSRLDNGQYISSIKGSSDFTNDAVLALAQKMRDEDADNDISQILGVDAYDSGKGVMGKVRRGLTPGASKLASGVDKGRGLLINFLYGSPEQTLYELLDRAVGFAEIAKDEFDKHVWSPLKISLFGTKGVDGFKEGGVFGGMSNSIKDVYASFGHTMTGKGFTNSKGVTVEDETDPNKTVWGNIRNTFSMLKDNTMSYIFGFKSDKEKPEDKVGIVDTALASIAGGFKHFGSLFFGNLDEESDEKTKQESVEEMKRLIKERAPKTIAGGMMGAVGGSFLGGGLLGTLVGGPVFGSVLGSTLGWFSQSEKFNDFMFGQLDEKTQERAGGIINKDIQNFFKSNKSDIIGGASIGLVKGMLFPGAGIMSSIVGGPVAGALMGTGLSLLRKTEGFQTFMYGKGEPGDDNYKKGVANIFKGFVRNEDNQNRAGITAVGAVGGASLSAIVGQMGIMGAMLTPFGPLGGAIAGASLGIATSSDKFRKYLFGDKDEEGKRQGGALSKIEEFMKLEVFNPIRDNISEIGLNVKWFFKEKIADKISDAVGPFTYQIQKVAEGLKVKVSDTFNSIKDNIHTSIIKPFAENMELHFFRPLKNFMGGLFGTFGKILGSIVAAPFSFLATIGQSFTKDHKKEVLHDASNQAFRENYAKQGDNDKRGIVRRLWDGGVATAKTYATASGRQNAYDESGTYLAGYDTKIKERDERQKLQKASEYADIRRQKDTTKLDQYRARSERFKALIEPGNIKSVRRYEKEASEYKKFKKSYIKKYGMLPESHQTDAETAIRATKPSITKSAQSSVSSQVISSGVTGSSTDESSSISNTSLPKSVRDRLKALNRANSIISDNTGMSESEVSEALISGTSKSSSLIKRFISRSSGETPDANITDSETGKVAVKKKDNVAKVDTGKEIRDTSKNVKDIRDEVKGQLNGVGANISKIRRMLAKSLGFSPDGDIADNNKSEVTLGDKLLNLLDSPVRGIGRFIGKGISGFTGGVSKIGNGIKSIGDFFLNIPTMIWGGIESIGKGLLNVMTGIGKGIFNVINTGFNLVGSVLKSASTVIGDTIKGSIIGLSNVITGTIGAIGDMASVLGESVVKVAEAVPVVLEATFNMMGTVGRVLTDGFVGLSKGIYATVSAGLHVAKEVANTGIEILTKATLSMVDVVTAPFRLVGKGLNWAINKVFGEKDKGVDIKGGWLESIKSPVRINPGDKPIEVIIVDSKKVLDTKDVNGTLVERTNSGILNSILMTLVGIASGLGISKGLDHLSKSSGIAKHVSAASLVGGDGEFKRTAIRRKMQEDDIEKATSRVELRGLTAKNIKARKLEEAEKSAEVERDLLRNDELKQIKVLTASHGKQWASIFGKTGLLTLGALYIFKKLKDFLEKEMPGLPIPSINGDDTLSTDGMTPGQLLGEQASDLGKLITTGNLKEWIAPDTDGNRWTVETNHMSGIKTKGLINMGRVWNGVKSGANKTGTFIKNKFATSEKGKAAIKTYDKGTSTVNKLWGKVKATGGKISQSEYGDAFKAMVETEKKSADNVIKMYNQFIDNIVTGISTKTGKLISRASLDEKLLGKMFIAIKDNYHIIAPKVSAVLGQTSALLSTGIGLIVKDTTWMILGAINGVSGAARLFGVDSKYVTPGMILISTLIGAASGTTIGIIVEIVHELIVEVMQIDAVRMLATLLYSKLPGTDSDSLASAQQEFKSKYDSYVDERFKEATEYYNSANGTNFTVDEIKSKAESGEITVHRKSFADYNHEQHKTLGSKLTDTWNHLVKGEFKEIGAMDVSGSKLDDSTISKAIETNTSAKLGLLDTKGNVIPMSSYNKHDYTKDNNVYKEQDKINKLMYKFYGKLSTKTNNYIKSRGSNINNFDRYMDSHLNSSYGINATTPFLSTAKISTSRITSSKQPTSLGMKLTTPQMSTRDFGAGESSNSGGLANGAVHYSQTDSRWADTALGNSTIGKIGCIVSSLAMGLSSLADKAITPNTIMSKYGKEGFDSNGSIRWDNVLGKSTKDNDLTYGASIANNGSKLKDYLSRNIPVLMFGRKSGNGNIYGKGNSGGYDRHAVLALGLDSNGKIIYNDPGNTNKSLNMGKYAADLPSSVSAASKMIPLMKKDGSGLSGVPMNAIRGIGGDPIVSEGKSSNGRTFSSVFSWAGEILTEGAKRVFDAMLTGEKVNTDYSDFRYVKEGTEVEGSLNSDMMSTMGGSATLKEEVAKKILSITSGSESKGDYSTVVANDNGSYSVGLMQFHRGNAKTMFTSLADRLTDPTLKKQALAYADISNRALSVSEANAMRTFLQNPNVANINKQVQDNQSLSRSYYNMSAPWAMYTKGKLLDPRSVVLTADMANTGNWIPAWSKKYTPTTDKASELKRVKDSLKSPASYWGASTGSKYYKGWMNRIDRTYNELQSWNPVHDGATEFGSPDSDNTNTIDVIKSSIGDYGSPSTTSSLDRAVSSDSFYTIPTNNSRRYLDKNTGFVSNYRAYEKSGSTSSTGGGFDASGLLHTIIDILSDISGYSALSSERLKDIKSTSHTVVTPTNKTIVMNGKNNQNSASSRTSRTEVMARSIAKGVTV